MSNKLVKRLRLLGDRASFEPHMHHAAADRIEAQEAALQAADELAESTRPFAACVFNDNGDVTVSQGNLKRGDWLRLDRTATAYRKARGGET